MPMTPQNTFSLALIAALVEDVVVEGRQLSRLVPPQVPDASATSEWWNLTSLGDTLIKLADQQCVRQPDMFRMEAIAAPPSAAALAMASIQAYEWVSPALRVFPSGADDRLASVVHAAVTYLITVTPATARKAAFSHAVVQAMMDTAARHRHHQKPGRND